MLFPIYGGWNWGSDGWRDVPQLNNLEVLEMRFESVLVRLLNPVMKQGHFHILSQHILLSFTNLFLQLIFIEHLLCARHYLRCPRCKGEQTQTQLGLSFLRRPPHFSSYPSHGQCSTKFTWKQSLFLLCSGVAVVHRALVVCWFSWPSSSNEEPQENEGLYPSLLEMASPQLQTSMGLWTEHHCILPWPQWLVQAGACDSGSANQIASLGFLQWTW